MVWHIAESSRSILSARERGPRGCCCGALGSQGKRRSQEGQGRGDARASGDRGRLWSRGGTVAGGGGEGPNRRRVPGLRVAVHVFG